MEDKRIIRVFIDDDPQPFLEEKPPVKIQLDTTKLADGKHKLKVVARSSDGSEGVRHIPFEVRNGPSISVIGLKDDDVVDNNISLTLNAYGSERKDLFIVTGSENPKAIPAVLWVLLLGFVGWALFYLIMYLSPDKYDSFF